MNKDDNIPDNSKQKPREKERGGEAQQSEAPAEVNERGEEVLEESVFLVALFSPDSVNSAMFADQPILLC